MPIVLLSGVYEAYMSDSVSSDIAADAARCAPVKGLPGNAVSAAADRGTLCHGKCRRKDYYENDNRNDKPSECAAFVFFFVFCVFSALR